jgi:hypothetical protein
VTPRHLVESHAPSLEKRAFREGADRQRPRLTARGVWWWRWLGRGRAGKGGLRGQPRSDRCRATEFVTDVCCPISDLPSRSPPCRLCPPLHHICITSAILNDLPLSSTPFVRNLSLALSLARGSNCSRFARFRNAGT